VQFFGAQVGGIALFEVDLILLEVEVSLRSKNRSASLRVVGEKAVVRGDTMGDGNSQGTGIARQPSERRQIDR
jgi:hypothetical protein